MPSLIDIRRRIRSVRNTQQITKAMKMVAAARLRKAQDRVISARPYNKMLGEILQNVAAAAALDERAASHPLLAARPEEKIQLVLFTADRGFAGAFNANLIKAAVQFCADNEGPNQQGPNQPGKVDLELRGKKGRDFFRRRPAYAVSGEAVGISEAPTYAQARELSATLIERFSSGVIDSVYILYNEFKSVLSQRVTLTKVLPMTLPAGQAARDYLYEQPPAELMQVLLPRYVELNLYRAMLESAAAEHAARMTAMDAATTNAAEVIDKLTLYMNRVRQASITKEIIEVVSGAAALE
jgi:F-type H+-transporting ATPase subunit gamma